MKYKRIKVFETIHETYSEETVDQLMLDSLLSYPNNSIEHERIYSILLANIDRVPIAELEEFLKRY